MKKGLTTGKILAALAALTALLAAAAPALLWAQLAGGFKFHGVLSRVITPNGDGKNDLLFFCFDNPSDSEVTVRLYTMLGAEVATASPRAPASGTACPAGILPNSAQLSTWDGRSHGTTVRSGVYVYRVLSEDTARTGTVLVVR